MYKSRDPAKQLKIELQLKNLKSKSYDTYAEKLKEGRYRTNRSTYKKNREELNERKSNITERLKRRETKQPKGDEEKKKKLITILELMNQDTNLETNTPVIPTRPPADSMPMPIYISKAKLKNIEKLKKIELEIQTKLVNKAKNILRSEMKLPVKIDPVKEYLLEHRKNFQGSMLKNQHTEERIKMLNKDSNQHYDLLMSGWKQEDRGKVIESIEMRLKEAYPHANFHEAISCANKKLNYNDFWPPGAEWDSYKYRYFYLYKEVNNCMYDLEVNALQDKYIQEHLDKKVAELKKPIVKNTLANNSKKAEGPLNVNNLRGGKRTLRKRKNKKTTRKACHT